MPFYLPELAEKVLGLLFTRDGGGFSVLLLARAMVAGGTCWTSVEVPARQSAEFC